MIRAALVLAALLVIMMVSASTRPVPVVTLAADGPPPHEQGKLLAEWIGDPCTGTLRLFADGGFERRHFSPGDNQLTGTWQLRHEAFPPTLVLKCIAADDLRFVGKAVELSIIRLDEQVLVYEDANQKQQVRLLRHLPDDVATPSDTSCDN